MALEKGNHEDKIKEVVEGFYSNEIIKTMVESVGFDKPPDDVLLYLAENSTFKVKLIVQEAIKFQQKMKRKQLRTCDIDCALRVKNIEPVYGFTSTDYIPFRLASGGGREIYFQEDSEVDLDEVMMQPLPKIPYEVAIKSHWLAVDGLQPAIPENPPPIGKDVQLKETIQPITKSEHINELNLDDVSHEGKQTNNTNMKDIKSKDIKGEHKSDRKKLHLAEEVKMEGQKFKPLVTHELSVEQQLYYKEITEACVGSNEIKRTEALQSLASDTGLYQLLPRFVTFIAEGVKVNVAHHNLALLIYLLRMIKALMENSTLYLEKYLHELIPSVITCIVSKKLCPRPDFDNHYALRDFAARLLAQMCKHFSTATNNIQSRITSTLCKSLYAENAPLVTHYGAIAALSELGLEVVKFLILPRLPIEGELMKKALAGSNSLEKTAAEHMQTLLLKHCSVVIYKTRSLPDILDKFNEEFGYLGPQLFAKVSHLRLSASQSKTPSTPGTPNTPIMIKKEVQL